MSIICPTVLAGEPHVYREQITQAALLSNRIHIDLMDGIFTDTKSIAPIQAWWPDGVEADIHFMFKRPQEHLETLVSLSPSMVIIHAESDGNLEEVMRHLKKLDIRVGVSFFGDTPLDIMQKLIGIADHILLFSGHLGHFGGTADLSLLQKVAEIKAIHPDVEIGWDGGANETNVGVLQEGGIDVINVGGALQGAQNPQDAYDTLVAKLSIT